MIQFTPQFASCVKNFNDVQTMKTALEQIAMEFLQINKNEFIAKLSGIEVWSNEINIFVELYKLNDMSCNPYSIERCQIAIRPPKNAPQSTRTTTGGD